MDVGSTPTTSKDCCSFVMKKTFESNIIEKKWYFFWKKFNYFFDCKKNGFFIILLPPPNITGNLHMGHAFQNTLIDVFLRYNSLSGKGVFLQGGTDHAGIATQLVIERSFLKKSISFLEFHEESYRVNVMKWVFFLQRSIIRQLMSLGTCVRWDRFRFTLDLDYSSLVIQSFLCLYENGFIYKTFTLVNWDPVLCTAISDLEVLQTEELCTLWYLRYHFVLFDGYLQVATTRPETIFADVAIAVHPCDERYKKYIGQLVFVPIVNIEIPIIADCSVSQSFGSGCLKITPAHDFVDFKIGKKHGLPCVNIFDSCACLNDKVPVDFRGLSRVVAREKIVFFLQKENLLEKWETYSTKVFRGDRSNSIVEPYLTEQWFIKMNSLIYSLDKVQINALQFVPKKWIRVYLTWLNCLKDWCISRQLWWGHRVPVWYDLHGNHYVGYNIDDVMNFYNLPKTIVLKQDCSVLDTWFSSALWPFSFLKRHRNIFCFKNFFPTTLLITGFDIIFFWVIRMVIFSLKFTKKLPFKTVFIHGLIRDSDGKKMSKFKGNILDPLDLMYGINFETLVKKRTLHVFDKKLCNDIVLSTKKQFLNGVQPLGIDALRFFFMSLPTCSHFISFDSSKVLGFRNFCNKLWNAARYVLLVSTFSFCSDVFNTCRTFVDKWVISEWQKVKVYIKKYYNTFKLSYVVLILYNFIKNEFFFWYVEFSKNFLLDYCSNYVLVKSQQYVLLYIFEEFLRALHPIMPFITEEIWQKFPIIIRGSKFCSIMMCSYPVCSGDFGDDSYSQSIFIIKNLVRAVRKFRSKLNIKHDVLLKLVILDDCSFVSEFFIDNRNIFFTLGNFIVFEKERLVCVEDLYFSERILIDNFIFFVSVK